MPSINPSDCPLAHPPLLGDCISDDPSLSSPESPPDPALPENFGNPNQVHVNAACHSSKHANSLRDINIYAWKCLLSVVLSTYHFRFWFMRKQTVISFYTGYSVSTSKNSSTQLLDEYGTHSGIDSTDRFVLQKVHCAEACAIGS